MDRPELPAPYYWQDRTTINAKKDDGTGVENVAWYWGPDGLPHNGSGKYECYSAPVGETEGLYRTDVDTEDEAVALIVSFALLGITKDGTS